MYDQQIYAKQINSQIPLHSVPATSLEHSSLSSGMIRHWNDKNSRPSCQISFHWIPQDSIGMTRILQELGWHCKDLHNHDIDHNHNIDHDQNHNGGGPQQMVPLQITDVTHVVYVCAMLMATFSTMSTNTPG